MNILGVYCGHCSTVALLAGGRIVSAVSEEKFDNIKNSSAFPRAAIRFTLDRARKMGISIDGVAVAGTAGIIGFQDTLAFSKDTHWLREFGRSLQWRLSTNHLLSRMIYGVRDFSIRRNWPREKAYILAEMQAAGVEVAQEHVMFVDHHTCHAYAAYCSMARNREEPALVFTMDGFGDGLCATVSKAIDGNVTRIAATDYRNSLGSIYADTTKFLGMKKVEHEYKVMGLAPYSREDYFMEAYERIFKSVLWLDPEDGGLTFKAKFPTQGFYYYLAKKAVGVRFDNLAAALQHFTETLIVQWVRNAVKQTGITSAYFGGGVFMNVKANMQVAEMPELRHVAFMPSCGDESTPIGAAYHAYIHHSSGEAQPFDDIYFGMDYTNAEVQKFITRNRLDARFNVRRYEDIESAIAERLSRFEVVARVSGKAEWGARALGNRSILANPSDMRSFFAVNDQIKCRDFWMPFAPSVLDVDADRYIDNPKHLEAPYMILGFRTKPLARKHLQAAMHQGDKTVRPQIVRKEVNGEYYRLVEKFKEITGIGGIMNTSFNLHGYPLAGTLEQAVFTFENSGLRNLALGNFMICKKAA